MHHTPMSPRLMIFELGRNRLALFYASRRRATTVSGSPNRLGAAAESLDLWEPFTRIREAIEEAQRAAR